MSLLTKDKLEAMFNQSKLRQQKKREQKKLKTKQRLKEIYHHQDQVLKKSFREEKKKLMDNLSTLIKQTPQKEKEPQIQLSYGYYQEAWQLKEPNDIDLYHSREELKEAEERGEGKINWNTWDSIVELTKKDLKQYEQ